MITWKPTTSTPAVDTDVKPSLAYAIGVVESVSVAVDCFGPEYQNLEFICACARENYDLTPGGIVRELHLLDVDYNAVSSYGHFGKALLLWGNERCRGDQESRADIPAVQSLWNREQSFARNTSISIRK